MNERERLIEDILDVSMMALQTATTPDGRRAVMAIMNYVKALRSADAASDPGSRAQS